MEIAGAGVQCVRRSPPPARRQRQRPRAPERRRRRHKSSLLSNLVSGSRSLRLRRCKANDIAHEVRGEHESQEGAHHTVDPVQAERIIEGWPDAPRNVARQMLEKYGPPNEATPTRLFWYRKDPWKRLEVAADPVVHSWPALHSDFFTQGHRLPRAA